MYHGYFLDNTPQKKTHVRRENKKHETIHKKKAKNTNIEKSELEERYQEIVDTKKSRRQKRKMKYTTQEITRKIKSKERTPQQQQKQKAHLLML